MSWIIWATAGYFLNAVAVAVDKALLGRRELASPAAYTLTISVLGLMVLVLVPFGFEFGGPYTVLWGLLSGCAFTLGLWFMFMVLKHGEASRVPAFIGALGPVFVFMFSYVILGERLTVVGVVAFILLVAGGFLMVGGKGGLSGRHLWLAVASAAVFGVAYVLLKLTFDQTTFITALVWSRLGAFLFSLLLLLVPGTWQAFRAGIKDSGNGVKTSFIGGQLSGAVAGLMNSYAVSMASVTLVNALQGVQYVFLLGMAIVVSTSFPQFFRDEFTGNVLWRKLAGTVVIVAGLAFLGNT